MKHNLLKGHIPLFITYWIFGIIPWIIYGLIGVGLNRYYLNIFEIPYIQLLSYLYLLFPFLYFPLIYIAIWNSSTLYTKNRLWPILAKLSVLLGTALLLMGAVLIINQFLHRNDIAYQIKEEVELINKSAPVKINDSTTMEKVSFDNKLVTYEYKILNKEKKSFNIPILSLLLKAQLIKDICKHASIRNYLSQGINFSYHYIDKNNEEVCDVLITQYDCR